MNALEKPRAKTRELAWRTAIVLLAARDAYIIGPRGMMETHRISFEIDAPGLRPESADPIRVLEAAASYFAALESIAEHKGQSLDLHGLQVVDKCVAIQTSAVNHAFASACVEDLGLYLSERVVTPHKGGLHNAMSRVRLSLQRLPPEHKPWVRVDGKRRALTLVSPEPESTRYRTIESLRVVIQRVGGDPAKVRVSSPSEDQAFGLNVSRDRAPELGALLYQEVDIVAAVERDFGGKISEGDLLEFRQVCEGSAFEEWRRWFAENASEWNDVRDVERELGRDD